METNKQKQSGEIEIVTSDYNLHFGVGFMHLPVEKPPRSPLN